MILRCQWIQEWIHTKSASLIMGVDSGGDDGLSVEDKDSSSLLLLEAKEEEEEELALLGGNNGVDFVEVDGGAEVVGAGAGDVAISRGETPVVGDGVGVLVDGGRGYKEVVPHIPPFITQQSASELVVGLARLHTAHASATANVHNSSAFGSTATCTSSVADGAVTCWSAGTGSAWSADHSG
jgi:hypothetical protein